MLIKTVCGHSWFASLLSYKVFLVHISCTTLTFLYVYVLVFKHAVTGIKVWGCILFNTYFWSTAERHIRELKDRINSPKTIAEAITLAKLAGTLALKSHDLDCKTTMSKEVYDCSYIFSTCIVATPFNLVPIRILLIYMPNLLRPNVLPKTQVACVHDFRRLDDT